MATSKVSPIHAAPPAAPGDGPTLHPSDSAAGFDGGTGNGDAAGLGEGPLSAPAVPSVSADTAMTAAKALTFPWPQDVFGCVTPGTGVAVEAKIRRTSSTPSRGFF